MPIGMYAAAAALGAGLALIVGGTVIQLVSNRWQTAFVMIGLGGLVLLPLLATVVEPARRNESAVAVGPTRIDRFIREHADFMVRHYVAVALYSAMIYAVLSWVPALFIRVHGWTPGETGLRYGLVLLLFGGAGTVLGGIAAAVARQARCAATGDLRDRRSAWRSRGRCSRSADGRRMDGPRWRGTRRDSCS